MLGRHGISGQKKMMRIVQKDKGQLNKAPGATFAEITNTPPSQWQIINVHPRTKIEVEGRGRHGWRSSRDERQVVLGF